MQIYSRWTPHHKPKNPLTVFPWAPSLFTILQLKNLGVDHCLDVERTTTGESPSSCTPAMASVATRYTAQPLTGLSPRHLLSAHTPFLHTE